MNSGNTSWGEKGGEVVTALFADAHAAEAAVRELRAQGVPAGDISLITRNEDDNAPDGLNMAGVSREEIGDEGLTYRVSSELPNDEDLPTTEAQMTGRDAPVVTDFEVPPNEPLGGSDRLGLSRDDDMVRRPEADPNADADIYTDFPGQPGGVNPESAAAQNAALQQEPVKKRVDAANTAVVGAGIGGVAGLLIGGAALVIPGVGPFLAAGPIAAALGGMIAGSAAGSVIGALSSVGIPEEYARDYAARIEEGQCLVSVRTTAANRAVVEQVLNGGLGIRD